MPAIRCVVTTEMTIDSISVSPPEPVDPGWVLLSISDRTNPGSNGRVARPYAERTKFYVGARLRTVENETPLHFVEDGYIVIKSTYTVT